MYLGFKDGLGPLWLKLEPLESHQWKGHGKYYKHTKNQTDSPVNYRDIAKSVYYE